MKYKIDNLLKPLRDTLLGKGTALLTMMAFLTVTLTRLPAQSSGEMMNMTTREAAREAVQRTMEMKVALEELLRTVQVMQQGMLVQQQSVAAMVANVRDPQKNPVPSEQPQVDKLQQLEKQAAAAGQPELADAINGLVDPNGPLRGLPRNIDANTPKAVVEQMVREVKAQAEKVRQEADKAVQTLRDKLYALPQKTLEALMDRALQEVAVAKEAEAEKLRLIIKEHLPQDVAAQLDAARDLGGFMQDLLVTQGLYPELVFVILKERGLIKEGPDGKLDLTALGLAQEVLADVVKVLPDVARAENAHEAAMATAMMAQNILTQAMMTGNPYVVALALVIAGLMAIFKPGSGGGGGGKGKGKGKGDGKGPGSEKEGKGPGTGKGGISEAPVSGGKPGAEPGKAPGEGGGDAPRRDEAGAEGGGATSGQGGNVSGTPGLDYRVVEGSEGLVITGQKLSQPLKIPRAAYTGLTRTVFAGDKEHGSALLELDSWTSQYIDSISVSTDSDGGQTLTIHLGGGKAGAKRPAFTVDGKRVVMKTARLEFKTVNGKTTGYVTDVGAELDASQGQ